MPLLGALLVNLFGGVATLFVTAFAKKVAVALAAVAAFATITGALYLALRGVLGPLLTALFSTSYGSLIGMAFPPIAGQCIGALSTTWLACTLYSWQKKAISLAASSN